VPESNQSSIELIRGGFRTITGAIGEQNRENYDASISNFATIGIRGTDYEVVITAQNEMITGVYDGGTVISSIEGSLDLGIQADYDFAIIRSPGSPPEGLMVQPAELGDLDVNIVASEVAEESSEAAEDDSDSQVNVNGSADQNDDNGAATVAVNNNNDADQNPANVPVNAVPGSVDIAGNNDDGIANAAASNALALTATNQNSGTNTEISNEPTRQISIAPPTPQFYTVNLQTGGTDFTAVSQPEANGIAASPPPVPQIPAENELLILAQNPETTSSDNTDEIADSDDSSAGDPPGNVDTASSGGNSSEDSVNNTDPTGGNDSDDNDNSSSDSPGGSGNSNGVAGGNTPGNSGNSNGVAGGNTPGNSGTSNGVPGSGSSNDADNNASSEDTNGTDSQVSDGSDSSTSNGNGNGNGNSGNTGNGGGNGNGNNAGSDFAGTTGGTNNGASSGDGNGASSGNGNSNSNSNSNSGNGGTTGGGTTGGTNNGASSGNGTSGNGGGNGNTGNGNGNANSGSLTRPAQTIQSRGVSWGQWDQPLDNNWLAVEQIDGELVRISTNQFFAEVTPTPIANLVGNHGYRTGLASSFFGTGSGGAISDLAASMQVNFDTGAISEGSLQVLSGDQSWAVSFDGLVSQGMVELNPLNGQLFDSNGLISNQIDAKLGGVFTGNNAEAFVGGFDLLDAHNPANVIEGLYTIER